MGHMKYVLQLAQNYRAYELESKILTAEAYNDKTIHFDGEKIPLRRAKGMYLIIKDFQDKETYKKLNG